MKDGKEWLLLATIEMDSWLASEEFREFGRLAKRFKGKYEYVENQVPTTNK